MKSNLRGKKLDKVFCIEMMNYYEHVAYNLISEASQLSNSVLILQQWGNMVIESNKGEKDVK